MRPLVSFLPTKTLNQHTVSNTFLLNIMSKTVALALLDRANTAEQILQVLDSIAQDFMPADITESAMVSNTPTLEPIAF